MKIPTQKGEHSCKCTEYMYYIITNYLLLGVDEEFVKLLGGIFGHDILDQFRRRRPSGWVEVMSMFESRKRTASPYRASSISIPLPFSFIDFFKKCRVSNIVYVGEM